MKALHRIFVVALITFTAAACTDTVTPNQPVTPSIPGPQVQRQWGTGYVMRYSSPTEVTYEIRGGRGILEGDIDLGPVENIPKTPEAALARIKGQIEAPEGMHLGSIYIHPARRWFAGVVYYDTDIASAILTNVNEAISHIEEMTVQVDFVPRTNQNDYVRFVAWGAGCGGNSQVGKVGGRQDVNIFLDCTQDETKTLIHELSHVLGMWHEQSRCDRDTYVEILWDNIYPVTNEAKGNFKKQCSSSGENTEPYGLDVFSYDESSIMHYSPTVFGGPSETDTTIRSLRGLGYVMGQGNVLSSTDIKTIDMMYHPYQSVQGVSISYPGGTPSMSWSASPGATSYAVSLRIYSTEYNAGLGTSTWDFVSEEGVGVTEDTSIQDPVRTHTGSHVCTVWMDETGSFSYVYHYEFRVFYGTTEGGDPIEYDAEVAPSTC